MRRFFRILVVCAVLVSLPFVVFQYLFSVPSMPDRSNSVFIPASDDTKLSVMLSPLVSQHPDTSGVMWLEQGFDAFATRILLINLAEDSIDLRTYIWQNDITGFLMLDAVRRAAERGVRVRLLLDDNGTPNLDTELAFLNSHPNIEIRLFNPFVLRSPRLATFVFDFMRVNRRMHNKSMNIDGMVVIAGGRNIGDIYFSASEAVNYFDLDVAVFGLAAAEVAADFDIYWASPSAVPVDLLLEPVETDSKVLADSVAAARANPNSKSYADALEKSDTVRSLLSGTAQIEWVKVELVSDNPIKGQGLAERGDLMIARLAKILGTPETSVTLVSAYFVPGDQLSNLLTGWSQNGVTVRTLTNSQEATDVLPVHAGYLKYRDVLLDGGIGIYELKSDQDSASLREMFRRFDLTGSSSASLHAKTFMIDRDQLFVGSFNFDPRSTNLNTEMGFLIHSPKMAGTLADAFDRLTKTATYHVTLTAKGKKLWTEYTDDGTERVYDVEPKTTWITRTAVWVIADHVDVVI
ncbi:MAG: phospholipase D family protein [Rhodobacteraceae bacterium]|nr:phospholipase D family protein [Paracoccaceae bacterium]